MPERKVNLEEIFNKQNPQDGKLPEWARILCIEACKQVLELAAENVNVYDYAENIDYSQYVDKQSITNKINQVE